MSREKILAEITTVDLKEVGIKPPKAPTQENKGTEKTKYCRFHKRHGDLIDEYIHMKDAIEILIQRSRLKQFTKNSELEKKTVELITDGNNKDVVVSMSVEYLNEFPEHVEITPYACSWEQFPVVDVIPGEISNFSPT
jgi:hypothetical protein